MQGAPLPQPQPHCGVGRRGSPPPPPAPSLRAEHDARPPGANVAGSRGLAGGPPGNQPRPEVAGSGRAGWELGLRAKEGQKDGRRLSGMRLPARPKRRAVSQGLWTARPARPTAAELRVPGGIGRRAPAPRTQARAGCAGSGPGRREFSPRPALRAAAGPAASAPRPQARKVGGRPAPPRIFPAAAFRPSTFLPPSKRRPGPRALSQPVIKP